MGYFQELWNNQPNTVIGLVLAILVLLGIYVKLLDIYQQYWSYLQALTRSKYFLLTTLKATISRYQTISNKKLVWVTRYNGLALKSRGDMIRACDLVLPKPPSNNKLTTSYVMVIPYI